MMNTNVPETDGELYAKIDALKANNGRKRPSRKKKLAAIAGHTPYVPATGVLTPLTTIITPEEFADAIPYNADALIGVAVESCGAGTVELDTFDDALLASGVSLAEVLAEKAEIAATRANEDVFVATLAAAEFTPEDGETQEAINAAMDTFGLTVVHVGAVQCAMETGLTAEEACLQVSADEGPRAAETVVLPAGNTPVAIDAANTTAAADPLLAPKGAPKVDKQAIAAKVALTLTPEQASKRAKFAAEKAALDDEEAGVKIAEYELVERLLAEGKSRPAISKETGITYSRLTYVKWHIDRCLPTPGMIA